MNSSSQHNWAFTRCDWDNTLLEIAARHPIIAPRFGLAWSSWGQLGRFQTACAARRLCVFASCGERFFDSSKQNAPALRDEPPAL